jgi:hypothetical protein
MWRWLACFHETESWDCRSGIAIHGRQDVPTGRINYMNARQDEIELTRLKSSANDPTARARSTRTDVKPSTFIRQIRIVIVSKDVCLNCRGSSSSSRAAVVASPRSASSLGPLRYCNYIYQKAVRSIKKYWSPLLINSKPEKRSLKRRLHEPLPSIWSASLPRLEW